MIKRWPSIALAVLLSAASLYAQQPPSPLDSAVTPPEWSQTQSTEGFNADTIVSLDSALAPVLKLYGFTRATSAEWKSPEGPVRATAYEMLDAPAAYGVFTQQRGAGAQATPNLIGTDSFRERGVLHVWQSNYFLKVEGPKNSEELLASAVSAKILGRSRKPPVSDHLPAENLVAGSEKYLLRVEDVGSGVGISKEQFGFEDSAEAATAAYRVNGKSARLLLLLYPTQHVAKKYADQMEAAGTPAPPFLRREGPLVGIVYGSTDEAIAQSILNGLNHEFKVTWHENSPGLGLGTMIVTIFTFIGLALLFTLLSGVGYGGLRVFVKSRYPNRVFDRPEDMEIIQLRLIQGVTRKELEG